MLQLLSLQLEIEQIDAQHINTISEQRLRHFIKILQEQCRELDMAIEEELFRYGPELAFSQFQKKMAKEVSRIMENDVRVLRHDLNVITNDVANFQALPNIKKWLKGFDIPHQDENNDMFMEFVIDELFSDMNDEMNDWPSPKPSPRKKRGKTPKKRKRAKR